MTLGNAVILQKCPQELDTDILDFSWPPWATQVRPILLKLGHFQGTDPVAVGAKRISLFFFFWGGAILQQFSPM